MSLYFSDAFPDTTEVFQRNSHATLYDFVDPDKMVIIVRRGGFTYDVLIQPDILHILRLLDPDLQLEPIVDLPKRQAEELVVHFREQIRKRLPLLKDAETGSHKDEISRVASKIYWGTYKLLTKNKKYGINPWEPYYIAVSKSLSDQSRRLPPVR